MSEGRPTDDGVLPNTGVSLGDLAPSGSRHQGRRSAVLAPEPGVDSGADDGVIVYAGTADGSLVAVETHTGTERWRTGGVGGGGGRSGDSPPDDAESAVVSLAALAALDGLVVAGERGDRGTIRAHDAATGEVVWHHDGAADVGTAQRETRFYYPFVVDLIADRGRNRVVAAVRRYERHDGERHFESVVLAFDCDGTIAWRYDADASPIALDGLDDRIAVAYNRCPGEHREGLVVLDAETGTERWRFDPDGDGDRRVGDVALVPDGALVASHADYRGYRLDLGGDVTWRVDLGRPTERAGEVVYAYPNHVHATSTGAVFLTGNTYPEAGRETSVRHPDEHAAIGVDPSLDGDGHRHWTVDLGGFVTRPAAEGDAMVVPIAQHFREREPETHGIVTLEVETGSDQFHGTEGIVTAAAVTGETVAAIEEPVRYHDEGILRGGYRLHVTNLPR